MRTLISLLALAALAACNGSHAREQRADGGPRLSGESGARDFALADFDKVNLRGPDDVTVRVGPAFSVRAEGDTGELERLKIEVVGGELRIGRESDDDWFSWGHDSDAVRVTVTMPAIRGASIAGSGNMNVDRAAAESFEAAIAGSGTLTLAAVEAQRVAFDIAGSGDVSAAGTARAIEVNIAGSGNVGARELRAERLEASIVGSGDVEAFVTGEARADIMGSGDVTVHGGARCTANSMGSGELRCAG
jgi:hypothetical protein